MAVNVYEPYETNFENNGLGALLPKEALVTEELNGGFELSLTCPLKNPGTLQYISGDYIIKADTPRGKQLFRIYNTVKKLNNTISVQARHIFYDNLKNLVNGVSAANATADTAIKLLFNNTVTPHRFNAGSTIGSGLKFNLSYSDINPVKAVFQESAEDDLADAGIIQLYGGELLRDNYDITLKASIGEDRGFTVRYRKNLTGLTFTTDYDDIITRIKPIGRIKQEGTASEALPDLPVYLPELYIDSPNIGLYFMPKTDVLECRNARVSKDKMTYEEAYAEMRARALELFEGGVDLPKTNAKINFALLSQTESYKEYAVLENIQLGDIVSVIHEELGVCLKAKCVKYKYDCVRGRYEDIELGHMSEQLSRSIEKSASAASEPLATRINAVDGRFTALEASGAILSSAERAWLSAAMTEYPVQSPI